MLVFWDKLQRAARKYRATGRFPWKSLAPLIFLIAVFLVSVAFVYALSLKSTTREITDLPEYSIFLDELEFAKQDPAESAKLRVQTKENPLFLRTSVVQTLYDYLRAATKELHAEQYAADPDYHHLQCVTTFSWETHDRMPLYTEAVREFLGNKQHPTLYHQDTISSFARRARIEKSIQKGLPVWPNQHGVVAITDIAENTCIGHFYGDEYLLEEFQAKYPFDRRDKMGDPFRRKWDYYLAEGYDGSSTQNLSLPKNLTVVIDAYFDFDHIQYKSDQALSLEQSQQKVTLEAIINDARTHVLKEALSAEDVDRLNTEFVYCEVDGVLMTFLLTHKEIRAGEQLFIYYGPNYG